jgi:uncharacterized membrane protein YfhO
MENLETLPRAFLVSGVINVPSDQVFKTMSDPKFSPQNQAVISNKNVIQKIEDDDLNGRGVLNYQKLSNDHIRVMTDTKDDLFLVVLNSFYPGWEAKINSQKVSLYQTDYAFWGVFVPKGISQVDFIYRPKSIIYGLIISVFSLFVFLIIIFFKKRLNTYLKK